MGSTRLKQSSSRQDAAILPRVRLDTSDSSPPQRRFDLRLKIFQRSCFSALTWKWAKSALMVTTSVNSTEAMPFP